jgi:hypothetical protein
MLISVILLIDKKIIRSIVDDKREKKGETP